jgi:hypothetical protein
MKRTPSSSSCSFHTARSIDQRSKRLQGDFEDIAAIDFTRSFAECMKRAHDILEPIITKR